MSAEDPAKRAFDLPASGRIQEAAPAAEQAGRALLAAGKPLEATAALTTAARLFARLGKRKHAATLLVAAEAPAAEVGRTADVLRARAEIASRAGDTAGAAAALRRAASADAPGQRAGDLVRLAQPAVAKGDHDAVTRARASLKDLLGDEGEELARPFYDAVCAALGDRREEVRDRWIAMRQAATGNGPAT